MGRLDNKVAVITGGASNPSLGRSMSIAFAREGAKVILTDIDIEGGKKVENEILKYPINLYILNFGRLLPGKL